VARFFRPDDFLVRPFEVQEGAIAQLGERLVCNQKVTGSIPVGSTSSRRLPQASACQRKNENVDNAWSRDVSRCEISREQVSPPRRCLLFKNPESFLLMTLSFQSEYFFIESSFENVAFAQM
jgi:hypothetical protein